MTTLTDRHSYNFGDTFGDPAETNSLPIHLPVDGPWCNQADSILEQDDAVRSQGGLAQTFQEQTTNHKGNSNAYES